MKQIAIVTEDRYQEIIEGNPYHENILKEERALQVEFEQQHCLVKRVSWSNPEVDWTQFDLVLIRSTWDYFYRHQEFTNWLQSIDGAARIVNPTETILWNMDKRYLFDLQQLGISIPQTVLLEKGSNRLLKNQIKSFPGEYFILKPTIAGAAKNTFKLSKFQPLSGEIETLLAEEDFLLQEFLDSVESHGEYSLVYINGDLTHCILKKAKAGDFRVQDDFGGSIHLVEPSPELKEFGDKVINLNPKSSLYARVDVCIDNQGNFCLTELELIEPELWFRLNQNAAKKLVAKILA
ncbi:ATP-grasp domain-containing protein [Luteibaculum oceani]|uniref:Prokaryotic glutathione synthetase ATP-binding domain-containing protein n=1 Tax=Luteibaculum oceani TaxID=1294296 RepID=A0A5C6VKW5_9FLAO|nr:hypothetical protein [Luteibaculum oceani]TXC85394.1 hypothetical protein FRX97_01855 [Luteibaculum oceani]